MWIGKVYIYSCDRTLPRKSAWSTKQFKSHIWHIDLFVSDYLTSMKNPTDTGDSRVKQLYNAETSLPKLLEKRNGLREFTRI